MNTRYLIAAVGIAVSVAFVSPATAVVDRSDIEKDVRAAVGHTAGLVFVDIQDDVVILTGAARSYARRAAEQAALANPGVERVINRISMLNR